MSFWRKTKRNYYAQLDNKFVTDDRKVWKAVSPLFSEKTFCKESIILKEHGKTITDNEKPAETFYNFFSNIAKNLNIDSDLSDITSQTNNADPVFRAVEKYANHSSILKIKRKIGYKGLSFSFKYVTRNKITKEIQKKIDSKKACQESDIPVKLIKNNFDVISPFIYNNFNNSIFSSCFPSELENANVTPVFKKKRSI